MPPMLLSPAYAALFALVFVFLSFRTVLLRRKFRVSLGSGQNPSLQRAIRVHANFAEYVPLALLLLFLVETQTGNPAWVHAFGITLLGARVAHAYGVSQSSERLRFRVFGMFTTGAVLVGCAIVLLARYLQPAVG